VADRIKDVPFSGDATVSSVVLLLVRTIIIITIISTDSNRVCAICAVVNNVHL
jgi:hypothetical protein